MLIAHGADVNVRDVAGDTPLHFAAANQNAAVLSLLLRAPLCDVNVANNRGETPAMWSVEHDNARALALLISAGANVGRRCLMVRALERENPDVLAIVVAIASNDGCTMMHLAALWRSHRLLAKLIEIGGNVNATNSRSETPCHMFLYASEATVEDALQSMVLLISAGANVHARATTAGRLCIAQFAAALLNACRFCFKPAPTSTQCRELARRSSLSAISPSLAF